MVNESDFKKVTSDVKKIYIMQLCFKYKCLREIAYLIDKNEIYCPV